MNSKKLLATYGLKWNPFSPELPNDGLLLTPKIEHFAFRSTGLGEFVAHLRKKKVEHNAIRVPLTGNIQINVLDPDGNHIEVQFAGTEEADLSAFAP